jgi:hypothetical protein
MKKSPKNEEIYRCAFSAVSDVRINEKMTFNFYNMRG